MVDKIYDNFYFKVEENKHDGDFVDMSWGGKRTRTTISVPIDRVSELASSIYDFLEDCENDDDVPEDTVCGFYGEYDYCLGCGCDCMIDEDF